MLVSQFEGGGLGNLLVVLSCSSRCYRSDGNTCSPKINVVLDILHGICMCLVFVQHHLHHDQRGKSNRSHRHQGGHK